MSLYQNKPFWITGCIFALVFAGLFAVRLDLIEKLFSRPRILSLSAIQPLHEKESWMNIFQKNRKIGFSHAKLSAENNGYHLQETVHMRINTMGLVQDIQLRTRGRLNADFSLADFDFEINSGRFSFGLNGSVSGRRMTIQTDSAAAPRKIDIPLKKNPYLLAGITAAIGATDLRIGDRYHFDIFDTSTMGQMPVTVEVIGREDIQSMGAPKTATKIALNFKGITQLAWIDETGDVIKERGILGIRLEKTTRNDALGGLPLESSEDLTQTASIPSNVILENLDRYSRLKIEISNIRSKRVQLDGGRQTYKDNVLTIEKESLTNLAAHIDSRNLKTLEKVFLRPTAFIQSDDQKIQTLAHEIVGSHDQPLIKIRSLVDWIQQNIKKRPVLSLPDALATLDNRMGDCNEHAVLLAALARAVGIPCRVEAGLVYLRGRFYYHAWNLVYLGRWITVDALFGQLPADVSHIRFVTGSPMQQLDLMGVIGNVKLKVIG